MSPEISRCNSSTSCCGVNRYLLRIRSCEGIMLKGDFVTFALKLVLEVFGIDASTLV